MGEVYGYDEAARTQCLTSEQRLQFHQEHSGPVMETLHAWLGAQFDERKVRSERESDRVGILRGFDNSSHGEEFEVADLCYTRLEMELA